MTKKPNRIDGEMAEYVKLMKAGKLNIRHNEEGKVIPEEEDYKHVEDEYPNESDAEKYRLAQASAMLRAKREYDQRMATGGNTESIGLA